MGTGGEQAGEKGSKKNGLLKIKSPVRLLEGGVTQAEN